MLNLPSVFASGRLNGSIGTVVRFVPAKSRWAIEVKGEGMPLLLKVTNLLPMPFDGGMEAVAARLPEDDRRAMVHRAVCRLQEAAQQRSRALTAEAAAAPESRAQTEQRLRDDARVWQLDDVFDAEECEFVIRCVHAAAARRGGWDRGRAYPTKRQQKLETTDLHLDMVPECEAFVRATIFRRVVRRLAPIYLPTGAGILPEHLEWRNAFYSRYSAEPGGQRALEMHTDGSIFSINVLLSDPCDFDEGGTYFEAADMTLRPPRGSALGHSGQARHSGVAITRGVRMILVCFIGCADQPYEVQQAEHAAHDAFLKFGDAAWEEGGGGMDEEQAELRAAQVDTESKGQQVGPGSEGTSTSKALRLVAGHFAGR